MFLQGPHWQLGLDLPFSCTLGGPPPLIPIRPLSRPVTNEKPRKAGEAAGVSEGTEADRSRDGGCRGSGFNLYCSPTMFS